MKTLPLSGGKVVVNAKPAHIVTYNDAKDIAPELVEPLDAFRALDTHRFIIYEGKAPIGNRLALVEVGQISLISTDLK